MVILNRKCRNSQDGREWRLQWPYKKSGYTETVMLVGPLVERSETETEMCLFNLPSPGARYVTNEPFKITPAPVTNCLQSPKRSQARTIQVTQSSPSLTDKICGCYFLDHYFGVFCYAAIDN